MTGVMNKSSSEIGVGLRTGSTTNYLDVGATTNKPARFYRVRLVP